MKRRQSIAGFTLVEVMIAMTLISIMMVLLVSSLKTSADSWAIGEKKIGQVNEKSVVYSFFHRHLSSARPLRSIQDLELGEKVFSFNGSKDTLTFVGSFPASAARKGLQQFELNFIDNEKGLIEVTLSPFLPATNNEPPPKEVVTLIENVVDLTISYFVRDDPKEEGVWEESWENKQVFPELVKIKIKMIDDLFWPEFIIPLKVDPVSGNKQTSDTDENGSDSSEFESDDSEQDEFI